MRTNVTKDIQACTAPVTKEAFHQAKEEFNAWKHDEINREIIINCQDLDDDDCERLGNIIDLCPSEFQGDYLLIYIG